jgi:hypothetical protein
MTSPPGSGDRSPGGRAAEQVDPTGEVDSVIVLDVMVLDPGGSRPVAPPGWNVSGVWVLLGAADESGRRLATTGHDTEDLARVMDRLGVPGDLRPGMRLLLVRRHASIPFDADQVRWLESRFHDLLSAEPWAAATQPRPGGAGLPVFEVAAMETSLLSVPTALREAAAMDTTQYSDQLRSEARSGGEQ